MPLIPFILALLFLFALILAMPLLLVLRYRAGTARRLGRRWIATVNLVSMIISTGLFLWVAAITTFWIRQAFASSLAGLMGGCLLGLLGLTLTRWEKMPHVLHYTPNRWLVLLITLAVTTRLLYGLWRIWHAWHISGPDTSWLASAGIAGSMAVGAIVLGYYLTYSAGVRWRLRKASSSLTSGGAKSG
ncbi:MAG: hypothetical protein QOD12_1198 [Verrucomicrobiota bacterium]|jgi:hypothetical protein